MKATKQPLPEVDTTDYEFSHGRTPRGYGSWAFCPWSRRNLPYTETRARWFQGTYAEARKQARHAFAGQPMISAMP